MLMFLDLKTVIIMVASPPIFIFQDLKYSYTRKDFIRGFHLAGTAYRTRGLGEQAIGAEFKDALTEAGGWKIGLWAFGECLPYADNRITCIRIKNRYIWSAELSIDCSFCEMNNYAYKHDCYSQRNAGNSWLSKYQRPV
jgi:hypothetical protein